MVTSGRLPIIIDTNIIHSVASKRKVPEWLRCIGQSANGAKILIPRNTLLECEYARDESILGERNEIRQAVDTLRQFVPDLKEPSVDLMEEFSIVAALKSVGFDVEIVDATKSDFEEAHRRVAKHLPPTERDSDEQFRDVLVWVMAVRIAGEGSGASVVSKDRIFWSTDPDILSEMRISRLRRCREISQAIGLGRTDPEVVDLLDSVTGLLAENGLPFDPAPAWDEIEVRSMERLGGRISRLGVRVAATSGTLKKTEADLVVQTSMPEPKITVLSFTGKKKSSVDGAVIEIPIPDGIFTPGDETSSSYRDKLTQLRNELRGVQ